jgi:tetratricopeptide (TPR) repeat protein
MEDEKVARQYEKGYFFGLIKMSSFEIADKYTDAAKQYKTENNNNKAVECYEKAAKHHIKNKQKASAAKCYFKIYKLSKNIDYVLQAYVYYPDYNKYSNAIEKYYIEHHDYPNLVSFLKNRINFFQEKDRKYQVGNIKCNLLLALALSGNEQEYNDFIFENKLDSSSHGQLTDVASSYSLKVTYKNLMSNNFSYMARTCNVDLVTRLSDAAVKKEISQNKAYVIGLAKEYSKEITTRNISSIDDDILSELL